MSYFVLLLLVFNTSAGFRGRQESWSAYDLRSFPFIFTYMLQ